MKTLGSNPSPPTTHTKVKVTIAVEYHLYASLCAPSVSTAVILILQMSKLRFQENVGPMSILPVLFTGLCPVPGAMPSMLYMLNNHWLSEQVSESPAPGLGLAPGGQILTLQEWEGGHSQHCLSRPLQAASQARQQHLSSLQDYMQRCTNELYWLDQQAKGRMQYDWSDCNLDYPSRRRQYEVGAGPGRARRGAGPPGGAESLSHCRISSIGTWKPKKRGSTSCTMRATSCWWLSTLGGTPLK